MQDPQSEDEAIELITEWPVTGSYNEDDSHTCTPETSGHCDSQSQSRTTHTSGTNESYNSTGNTPLADQYYTSPVRRRTVIKRPHETLTTKQGNGGAERGVNHGERRECLERRDDGDSLTMNIKIKHPRFSDSASPVDFTDRLDKERDRLGNVDCLHERSGSEFFSTKKSSKDTQNLTKNVSFGRSKRNPHESNERFPHELQQFDRNDDVAEKSKMFISQESVVNVMQKSKTADGNKNPFSSQESIEVHNNDSQCGKGAEDGAVACGAERELPVIARLARWWRRQGRQLVSATHQGTSLLPDTNNPNTLLFRVARLPEGRAFLQEERDRLRKTVRKTARKERGGDGGDVLAALGTIEDWLGNADEAVSCLTQAVTLQPDNREWRWWLHKAQRQQAVKERQRALASFVSSIPAAIMPARQVDRVSCHDLSFLEFFRHYASQRRPVIITDLVTSLTPVTWDLHHIRQVAGQCQVMVKRSVRGSVEWAGLEDSSRLTVAEFLEGLERGRQDYLFDWSLPLHCPQLAQQLTIPRYFAGDFLQRTAAGSLYRDSWPSLFIAPAGVSSGLHVDAFASNFWMALFQGRKRWLFYREEDLPCLYPVYAHSLDPSFEISVDDPDLTSHPLMTCAQPMECVLNAGELLYVPGGSPHCVDNLDTSLAISANVVDLSNFPRVLRELDISGLLDPRAADLAAQLRRSDFLVAMKEDVQDLPWSEFKSAWPPKDVDQYTLTSCEHSDQL